MCFVSLCSRGFWVGWDVGLLWLVMSLFAAGIGLMCLLEGMGLGWDGWVDRWVDEGAVDEGEVAVGLPVKVAVVVRE